MAEKSWHRHLAMKTNSESRYKFDVKDDEGKPILMPQPSFQVEVKTAFDVALRDTSLVQKQQVLHIGRYKKEDREVVERFGHAWREPSAFLDEIVARFRAELEVAMRDAMPWDGEF